MVPNIKKKMDTHATDFNQNGAFFLSSRGRWNIKGNVRPASRDNMTGLFCSHKRKQENASAKAFSLCIRWEPISIFSIRKLTCWAQKMGAAYRSVTTLPCDAPIICSDEQAKGADRQWRSSPLSVLSEDSRPVVGCPLKRPNHGQRRVPLRSGWTPSLHDTWG